MFAITGITGNVGGELARSLLAAIEFESGEAGSRRGRNRAEDAAEGAGAHRDGYFGEMP